ncbi:MAG TPA: MHYT domain-containing protein, partial [Burkholderiaceae bacterium]|nr:MHYT domain-containing protein [Burkholderiaceae bacterium]
MQLLTFHCELWVLAACLLVASLASYAALHLVGRVRGEDRVLSVAWLTGGCLTMGTGIWSLHFVGIQAFLLPVDLGYAPIPTFVSWSAAVAVAALALWLGASGKLHAWRFCLGALGMGAGICAMHFVGLLALAVDPPVVWDDWLVAACAAISVAASAVTLQALQWLRHRGDRRSVRHRLFTALAMGLAISGTHLCA